MKYNPVEKARAEAQHSKSIKIQKIRLEARRKEAIRASSQTANNLIQTALQQKLQQPTSECFDLCTHPYFPLICCLTSSHQASGTPTLEAYQKVEKPLQLTGLAPLLRQALPDFDLAFQNAPFHRGQWTLAVRYLQANPLTFCLSKNQTKADFYQELSAQCLSTFATAQAHDQASYRTTFVPNNSRRLGLTYLNPFNWPALIKAHNRG